MSDDKLPLIHITFRPTSPDWVRRLRLLLKVAKRWYGFVCVSCHEEPRENKGEEES